MAQPLFVRTENNRVQLKAAWISIIFSVVLVLLPPLAVYAIGNASRSKYDQPSFFVYVLAHAGVVFVGGFLFPVLPLGTLILAVVNR